MHHIPIEATEIEAGLDAEVPQILPDEAARNINSQSSDWQFSANYCKQQEPKKKNHHVALP